MGFPKRELIQFFDRLMELVREECQIEAKFLAGMFLIEFERKYQYETEITEKEKPYLLIYHMAAMPETMRQKIRE